MVSAVTNSESVRVTEALPCPTAYRFRVLIPVPDAGEEFHSSEKEARL